MRMKRCPWVQSPPIKGWIVHGRIQSQRSLLLPYDQRNAQELAASRIFACRRFHTDRWTEMDERGRLWNFIHIRSRRLSQPCNPPAPSQPLPPHSQSPHSLFSSDHSCRLSTCSMVMFRQVYKLHHRLHKCSPCQGNALTARREFH